MEENKHYKNLTPLKKHETIQNHIFDFNNITILN